MGSALLKAAWLGTESKDSKGASAQRKWWINSYWPCSIANCVSLAEVNDHFRIQQMEVRSYHMFGIVWPYCMESCPCIGLKKTVGDSNLGSWNGHWKCWLWNSVGDVWIHDFCMVFNLDWTSELLAVISNLDPFVAGDNSVAPSSFVFGSWFTLLLVMPGPTLQSPTAGPSLTWDVSKVLRHWQASLALLHQAGTAKPWCCWYLGW